VNDTGSRDDAVAGTRNARWLTLTVGTFPKPIVFFFSDD
jgi:hypothetical protein